MRMRSYAQDGDYRGRNEPRVASGTQGTFTKTGNQGAMDEDGSDKRWKQRQKQGDETFRKKIAKIK